MLHSNGKENGVMTARFEPPTPQPEDTPTSRIHLWGLRLWVLCAIVIVAAGVANYLLSLFFGDR
jgi:hypothetical protein